MNFLHIIDQGRDSADDAKWRLTVSFERQHERATPFMGHVTFTNPMTDEDRKEFKWYLEEYLQFPFGAEEAHAAKVEKRMAEWGEAIFNQVFIKSDKPNYPYELYTEAVRCHLRNCELCICSEDADLLNVPWELIHDPDPSGGYLALKLGGFFRQRAGHRMSHPPERPPDRPFRILLVVSRPDDVDFLSLSTEARPLLEAIRPLRPKVELEVLRPPTFDELQRRLNEAPGFFDLVHFDGHGVFKSGMGHLAFETSRGKLHSVSSEALGEALAESAPIFVLSACQSGVEGGTDPYSSVASQVIASGAKGVVAMSHSVGSTAAGLFMRRLYETVLKGESLSGAVTAARRRLHSEPQRPSIVGELKHQDWMLPVLYLSEREYAPIPNAAKWQADKAETQDSLAERAAEVCKEGKFGFIGRDYDIHLIERALRDAKTPWALISGIGGIGKTELAYGFARWFAETGGCPGGVFATDFKNAANLGQVIGSIAGFGTDFSRLVDEAQWKAIIGYLKENPCLLIWDNFETAAGYPEGADALASDEERQKLLRFLNALRGGKSRIIITSRKPDESWTKAALQLVELGGLKLWDAAELAKAILSTVGRKPDDFKSDPDYARLVKLLMGHPRSMEVVLPLLKTKSPRLVIDALQHKIDGESLKLEDASLAYAFSQMSQLAQRHLPFIGLFATNVHAGMPGMFPVIDEDKGKLYEEVLGEVIDTEAWQKILDEAHRAGLIGHLAGQIYGLHPTLPAFLRRKLKEMAGEERMAQFDAEFVRFYAMWADGMGERAENADPNALAAISVEEGNLLRAVRIAEIGKMWTEAQAIAQTLNEFYEARGRLDEWRALLSRLLTVTGRKMTKDADRARANLWMFLLSDEANYARARNELHEAEEALEGIVGYLLSLEDPAEEPIIAKGYHNLGFIAQERRRFDEARELFRKAMEISERFGLERGAAANYHHLGMVAQELNRFDKAQAWFRKALEIRERLGLERDAAKDYHHLGMVAQELNRFDKAQAWFRKALEIRGRLGLERDAAVDYHHLGMVAQERQKFDKAEEWFRKALEIFERLDLKREAAADYHHLGIVAKECEKFDEAEAWYRKALKTYERLGLKRDVRDELEALGVVRIHQGRFAEAVPWMGKAYGIAAEYKMPVIQRALGKMAILMQRMGEEAFVAAWREAFEGEAPPLDELREAAKKIDESVASSRDE